jgi:predicted nucleic acid-binding protein
MTVLVDSDILIEVTRGVNEVILDQWMELSESTAVVLCSVVTIAELWGERTLQKRKLLNCCFGHSDAFRSTL